MSRTVSSALAVAFSALVIAQSGVAGDKRDIVVDERGAAVIDERDNCVRTKWDANSDMCNDHAWLHDLENIYFGFDSDRLTEEGRTKLDAIAAKINGDAPSTKLQVAGYADRIGNADYNIDLSRRRAMTVKNYLEGKGIDTSMAEVRALGETDSVTSCEGEKVTNSLIECLAADRRVKVEIRSE